MTQYIPQYRGSDMALDTSLVNKEYRFQKEEKERKKKMGERTRELSVGEREENLQGKKVSVCTQEFGLPVPQECLATNSQQRYVQSIIKWWEGARSSQGGGAQGCGSETRLSSPDE